VSSFLAAVLALVVLGTFASPAREAGALSQQFTITNETRWNASGLHVEVAPGQYIGTIGLVGEYPDCHGPTFAIPIDQGEASVAWPRACIEPGQYVTVRLEGDCAQCSLALVDSWWSYEALGDANCDRARNSVDALELLQVVAHILPNAACPENVDVNGDGEGNALDASLLLQFSAGLLPSLPV
jgi:hypothetical protein